MKLQIGDTKTISVCKRNRNSKWGNGTTRRTDKGMKMVITVSKNSKGQKISTTSYE